MNRQDLQTAATRLLNLPFPSSPTDPDLGDWIMDLLEADSYYAGLAQSALDGASFDRPPADSLTDLAHGLEELHVSDPRDEVILEGCREYFAALLQLHETLSS